MRDREGISAATGASAAVKDADGTGKARGSSDYERRALKGLDVPPDGNLPPSSPEPALPQRPPPQPGEQPAQISTWRPEPTSRPTPEDRAHARDDRINEADSRPGLPER
jgi:hypothetical protein